MTSNNNSVLFVSYYFPPAGGSGVLRIIRFIKNVQCFGWHPFVITVDERDIQKLGYGTTQTDESYSDVAHLTGTKKVRLFRPSGIAAGIFKWVRAFLTSILESVTGKRASGNCPRQNGGEQKPKNIKSYHSSDINALLKFLFEIVLIVDQAFEWAPRAIWHGIRYVRRNSIGVVCSSSPPWSVHIVGLMLKLFCRMRWILDLRDPIFGIETSELRTKSSPWLIRMFYRMLESILIRGADVVVCNCEEVKQYYQSKYSWTRFEVITNSFDPDDFAGMSGAIEPKTHREISHFGELYPTIRTPDAFFEAFSLVLEDNPRLREEAEIHFYGSAYYCHSKPFQDVLTRLNLISLVSCHDYIPHDEALRRMISSDVLLLLQPHYSTNYQIPAKIYEYIATRRPILALAPHESATSRLIREKALGLVCDPSDAEAVKSGISAALKGDLPMPDDDAVMQFSARHMAGKLVEIIDSLN